VSSRQTIAKLSAAILQRGTSSDGTAVHVPATGARLTGRALVAGIEDVSRALQATGVQPGDRVALWCGNDIRFVTGLYGIQHAGAAAVPINPRLPAEAVAEVLRRAAVRGVLVMGGDGTAIADAHWDAFLDTPGEFVWIDDVEAPRDHRAVASLPERIAAARAVGEVAVEVGGDGEATIVGTSGTTGPGKAVRLSHGNVATASGDFADRVSIGAASNVLIALPLSSSFGHIALLTGALLRGAAVTLLPRFSPGAVLDAYLQHGVTHTVMVPTMYAAVAQAIEERGGLDGGERTVLGRAWYGVGGAPMPTSLTHRFDEQHGIHIRQGFGMTETASVASFNDIGRAPKPESAGSPLPCCQFEIVDETGKALPANAQGELVVTGDNVMLGYIGETALPRPGRLHTGDIGYLDENGHLVLVDRIKDVIIRGGENIYPRPIESVIGQVDGVAQAALVGKPDDFYGEVPVAFIVRKRDDLTEQQILDAVAPHIAASARPVEFRFVDALPLGPTGKILKRQLRDTLSD